MNVVYLMMDEKKNYALFKAGFASNLATRVDAYTTHNPEVRCISYVKTMEKSKHQTEKLFHKEIAKRGYTKVTAVIADSKETEWFKVSYDDPFYTQLCELGLCAFKCGKNRKNYGEFFK